MYPLLQFWWVEVMAGDWLRGFSLLHFCQVLLIILFSKYIHWTICIFKKLSHQLLILRRSLVQPEAKSGLRSVYTGCIDWIERTLSSKHYLFTENFSNPCSGDQNLSAESSKPQVTTELNPPLRLWNIIFGTSFGITWRGNSFAIFSFPMRLAATVLSTVMGDVKMCT